MKKTVIVCLLILSMVFTTAFAGRNDIVNLGSNTIVDDTAVLKEKVTVPGTEGAGCPIDTPVNHVTGMTYSQYINYINDYYGYTPGDGKYITGTATVPTSAVITSNSSFAFANNFDIGSNMGAEGSRRQITDINANYSFYKKSYRLYGSIALNQVGNGNGGWFTGGLYFGTDKTYAADGSTTKAGTDKLPPVPWFSAVMKERGTVYVNAYCELAHLLTKGYKLISNNIEAYKGVDTNNNSTVKGPTYIYYKVFEKGETVEIFNQATGVLTGHPASWFFTTGIPDNVIHTYGKKSSGVVATSYNKNLTNGILYKDLFADVENSSETSGGRWVSDFEPLGAGQRIESIEDESLKGCDYFTFSINNKSKFGTFPGSNILEFKVDKYCDVVILTIERDSAAEFAGFTKATKVSGLTGMYPQSNFLVTVKNMGISPLDISIDMVDDLYKSSGLTFNQVYDKWLGKLLSGYTREEAFEAVNKASTASTIKQNLYATMDSVSSVTGTNSSFVYNVTHTKSYNPGDTVKIPDPTGKVGFDRPIMVVVKPRYTSKAPSLPDGFKAINANIGANAHFKPVHQYACMQNPPDFTWPEIRNAHSFDLIVCKDEALTDVAYRKDEISYSYYNFPYAFEPGTYWWAVRYRTTDGGEPSSWSVARRFRIDPSAHEYIVPDFVEVVDSIPETHPRIWFNSETIDDFVALKNTPYGNTAYQKMITQCNSHMSRQFTVEPEYGASNATASSTNIGYTAQNAALCYILTDEPKDKKKYGDFAVAALKEMSTWDMLNGGSAFNSNDQSFFEFLLRAAMAYDWMYNYMSEDDRITIRNMLVERFDYLNNVVNGGKGQLGALRTEPFNSHLWSYIGYYGMTCLALVHDVEGVDDYFIQMLQLNSAHLPPMSVEDGGWSKGTAYWTYAFTRDKWFMDAMKYGGYIDYYDKAWARNELNWVLYMYPDNSYGSFGDEAGLTKAGTSHIIGLSKLGKFTDNPVAYWLRNKIGNIETQIGSGAFDTIIYADTALEEGEAPVNYPNAHLFPDQGMVAMHSSIISSDRTSLYFRSGQYGSYNHMHADQNAFMIEHNGNRLATKSGFYDSYHSVHDKNFTRQTFAHNSITYNGGFGQKDDYKDPNSKIKQFVTHHKFDAAVGDAASAYVGNIDKFDRSIIYLRPDAYIVVDELANDVSQTYEWWLNSPADTMTVAGKTVRVKNNGSCLDVEIVSGNVADGVFSNDYINPSDGKEYPPDMDSSKVTEEKAEAGFDKVYFQTGEVPSATIVATMSVNEGTPKTFTKTVGTNYIKLSLDGTDTVAYVSAAAGNKVTTDSGYTFIGTALVVSGDTLMLVNGTELSYGGNSIIDAVDEPITFVVGQGQMSLGVNDDVKVRVHKSNSGISQFLSANFSSSGANFDMSAVTDAKGRSIEKYNGKAHGSTGIMMDYKDSYFDLYADKGQYMLLTDEDSFINTEVLIPSNVQVADAGKGTGLLMWEADSRASVFEAEINGEIHRNITSPYEFEYGDATRVDVKLRTRCYDAVSSWTETVSLYPDHKLDISFVKFVDNNDGTVSAKVRVNNNASSGVLRCKVIVASYNSEGNVVSVNQTRVVSVESQKEKLFDLAVSSEGAENYKAFIWNNTGDVHVVAGASNASDFEEDSGVYGGKVSASVVANEYATQTNGLLYANLHGRTEADDSVVNGGRIVSNYPTNGRQYHEITTADESITGYDYFVFNAGSHNLSSFDTILSFDIVEDSEVIILSDKRGMEFEGYTEEYLDEGYLTSRYMNLNFTGALRAIGITPTYAMATEFDELRIDKNIKAFEEKYITEAYAKATDAKKTEFNKYWTAVTTTDEEGYVQSCVARNVYRSKYSGIYTLEEGEETHTVRIPQETSGKASRSIVVVVKPYNRNINPNSSAVCAPLVPVASSNAQPKQLRQYPNSPKSSKIAVFQRCRS